MPRAQRNVRCVVAAALLGLSSACAFLSGRPSIEDLALEAALGNPDAKYALAVEFYRGERLPRDLAKAANLWRQLADSGSVPAHNNLGYLTYHGLGVARDRTEGMRLWRFAAERGHAEAQFHLGYAYSDENAPRSDPVEALAWALTSRHAAGASRGSGRPGGGPAVEAVAEDLVAKLSQQLSEPQRRRAAARAREYIASYGPRDE